MSLEPQGLNIHVHAVYMMTCNIHDDKYDVYSLAPSIHANVSIRFMVCNYMNRHM